jgi:hypothetical protein
VPLLAPDAVTAALLGSWVFATVGVAALSMWDARPAPQPARISIGRPQREA